MTRNDFHIGLEFWFGEKRWRCTDVGSRVVVAISLEPHQIVRMEIDKKDPGNRIERKYMTDDPSWLNGPPYAVEEYVLDEDALPACTLSQEKQGD